MGWTEYYQGVRPISLGNQQFAYQNAIFSIASSYPHFLNLEKPHNFVLGGFHPYTDTPETFYQLCQKLHPNPNDRHILMDMNKEPLASRKYPYRVQARLENLPFKDIDLLFLDSTLLFMEDKQIIEFVHSAISSLSCDGLILSTISQPLLPKFLANSFGRLINRNTIYNHSNRDLKNLTKELKIIDFAEYDIPIGMACSYFSLLVLSRHDSSFLKYPYLEPHFIDQERESASNLISQAVKIS